MSYFFIYGSEDGTRIKQFRSSDHLKDYLQEYWSDEVIHFMSYVAEDQREFHCGDFIVIKGEVIMPKPVNIVKTFEIE